MQPSVTCRCDISASPAQRRAVTIRRATALQVPAAGGKLCVTASLAFHAGILALLGNIGPPAMPFSGSSEPGPAQVTALRPLCCLFDPPPPPETATPRQEARTEPLPEADWNALLKSSQPKQPIEEEPQQATELEDIAAPAPAIAEFTANPPQGGGTTDTEAALAFVTDAGDWAKLKLASSAVQPGGDGVASGGGGQGSLDGVGLGGDGRSGNGTGSADTGGNGAGSGHGQGIPGGTGTSEGAGTPLAAKSSGPGSGPSRAARLVRSRTGAYPAAAREAGIEGTVQVRVQVLEDGAVGSVSVWRSSGSKELDDAALQAVKGWTFEPARRDGQPATSWATVSYRYELRRN